MYNGTHNYKRYLRVAIDNKNHSSYHWNEIFAQVRQVLEQTSLPLRQTTPGHGPNQPVLKRRVSQAHVGQVRSDSSVGHFVRVEVCVRKQVVEHGTEKIRCEHLKNPFRTPLIAVPPSKGNPHVLAELHTSTGRVIHQLCSVSERFLYGNYPTHHKHTTTEQHTSTNEPSESYSRCFRPR